MIPQPLFQLKSPKCPSNFCLNQSATKSSALCPTPTFRLLLTKCGNAGSRARRKWGTSSQQKDGVREDKAVRQTSSHLHSSFLLRGSV